MTTASPLSCAPSRLANSSRSTWPLNREARRASTTMPRSRTRPIEVRSTAATPQSPSSGTKGNHEVLQSPADTEWALGEVPLGRAEGVVAQDELDVLQRYLARVEDASEGSAQIVGTEIVESDLVTVAC